MLDIDLIHDMYQNSFKYRNRRGGKNLKMVLEALFLIEDSEINEVDIYTYDDKTVKKLLQFLTEVALEMGYKVKEVNLEEDIVAIYNDDMDTLTYFKCIPFKGSGYVPRANNVFLPCYLIYIYLFIRRTVS